MEQKTYTGDMETEVNTLNKWRNMAENVGYFKGWVKAGIPVAFLGGIRVFVPLFRGPVTNSGYFKKYPFIVPHQLLHIPNQTAPLSQCFVRAQGNSALH